MTKPSLKAPSRRVVYTSISVTPDTREMLRTGSAKLTGILGRRVGLSESIRLLIRLLDDPAVVAKVKALR